MLKLRVTGRLGLAGAMLLITASAGSRTLASPVEVVGALSNFDVWNRTGDSTDGFEVEIHGVDSSDVFHTFRSWGFPSPEIFTFASGVRVVYDERSQETRTAPEARRHFGVSLRREPTRVVYNWLVEDPAGNLVHAPLTPGAGTPSTLPAPEWTVVGEELQSGIRNDNNWPMWLRAANANNDHEVTLEELMTDDPLITALGEPVDAEPRILNPGDSMTETEDLLEATGPGGVAVFWVYEYTGPVDDSNNAMNENFAESAGDRLGTVMAAVNLVPEPAALTIAAGALLFMMLWGLQLKRW